MGTFWGMNLARLMYPSGVHPDSRQDGRGLASCSQPLGSSYTSYMSMGFLIHLAEASA